MNRCVGAGLCPNVIGSRTGLTENDGGFFGDFRAAHATASAIRPA